MTQEEYDCYPDFIVIRELKIRVENKGFRTQGIIVHTSLWDDTNYSKGDIAALFRRHLQAELNLRNLKSVMKMGHFRCKEPHRVRNELRTHLLAYNLIRQVMCDAAPPARRKRRTPARIVYRPLCRYPMPQVKTSRAQFDHAHRAGGNGELSTRALPRVRRFRHPLVAFRHRKS